MIIAHISNFIFATKVEFQLLSCSNPSKMSYFAFTFCVHCATQLACIGIEYSFGWTTFGRTTSTIDRTNIYVNSLRMKVTVDLKECHTIEESWPCGVGAEFEIW